MYFVPCELLPDADKEDDDDDLFVGNGGAAGNGRIDEDFFDAGPLFTPGFKPVCFFGELLPISEGLLFTVLDRLKLPPATTPPSLVFVLFIVSLMPS